MIEAHFGKQAQRPGKRVRAPHTQVMAHRLRNLYAHTARRIKGRKRVLENRPDTAAKQRTMLPWCHRFRRRCGKHLAFECDQPTHLGGRPEQTQNRQRHAGFAGTRFANNAKCTARRKTKRNIAHGKPAHLPAAVADAKIIYAEKARR